MYHDFSFLNQSGEERYFGEMRDIARQERRFNNTGQLFSERER